MPISVVIPTYNRAPIAARTIASVLTSTAFAAILEVIVVDDRSNDGSLEELSRQGADEKVTVVSSTVKGRAGARNTGLRLARGEIVLFLDDDVRVDPGLVGAHLSAHASHDGPVAVQGRLMPDTELPTTVWGEYEDRRFVKIHQLASKMPQDAPYNCFLTGNVSVSRVALEQVGGFDESFTGYGFEDYDLGRRLRRRGVPLLYAQEAVAYHRSEPLTLGQLCRKRYAAGRSAALLISKAPEAVAELDMEAPFSLPPHWERPSRDGLLKTVGKTLFFTRATATALAALVTAAERRQPRRLVPLLLYCWYGMGFKAARAEWSRPRADGELLTR